MASKKTTRNGVEQEKSPDPGQQAKDVLELFHPVTAEWFRAVFDAPTAPQVVGWPAIARGESTLILAPTGTGKTLTAFLWCLDRLMLQPAPDAERRHAAWSISVAAEGAGCGCGAQPSLAAGRDREHGAARRACRYAMPEISVRTGDTSQKERARFRRHPADILITTPESLVSAADLGGCGEAFAAWIP